jgi:uncharacterized protein (TIGR02246 family)
MDEQRIPALESRLCELEARLAIMQLEAEYARSWDAGDAAGWAALFTEDGVFDLASAGHQARRIVNGRAALATFCREIDGVYKGLHFMHLPALRIEGNGARGLVHFQWLGLYRPSSTLHGQRHVAVYYDVMYRRVDGSWLMHYRLERTVSGTQSEGYGGYPDAGVVSR